MYDVYTNQFCSCFAFIFYDFNFNNFNFSQLESFLLGIFLQTIKMFRLFLAFCVATIVSATLYTDYEPAQKFMWEVNVFNLFICCEESHE